MHKRLVALPGRQAAEHRRGGGREVVSISRVEGRTGDAARVPGVATSRKVRAREPQPRTLQRGLAPPPAAVDVTHRNTDLYAKSEQPTARQR